MSDTATFHFETIDELDLKMAECLRRHGWSVFDPKPVWMTPLEAAQSLGITSHQLCTKLRKPNCPDFLRQGNKRTTHLVLNQQLKDFILK